MTAVLEGHKHLELMVLGPATPSHQRVQNSPSSKYRKWPMVRNWVKLTSAKTGSTRRRRLQVRTFYSDFWRNTGLIAPRRWSSQHQHQPEDSRPIRPTGTSSAKPAQPAAGRPTGGPPSWLHPPCSERTSWPSTSSAVEHCHSCRWFTRRRPTLPCFG